MESATLSGYGVLQAFQSRLLLPLTCSAILQIVIDLTSSPRHQSQVKQEKDEEEIEHEEKEEEEDEGEDWESFVSADHSVFHSVR
jgi:hypothetical protein